MFVLRKEIKKKVKLDDDPPSKLVEMNCWIGKNPDEECVVPL